MKKLVSVQEIEGEGLTSLMGEYVLLMCLNYFYYGKLTGVNESCVLLEDVSIIYETGAWNEKSFKDKQPFAKEWYVNISAIESFGKSPKS